MRYTFCMDKKRPLLTLKRTRTPDKPVTVPVPAEPSVEATTAKQEASRLSDQASSQLAEWLGEHSVVWRDFLPLRIGVIEDVYALMAAQGMQDRWSKRVIHKTLRWHTSRTCYWERLMQGGARFGLDGQVSGVVTARQRHTARQAMRVRQHWL